MKMDGILPILFGVLAVAWVPPSVHGNERLEDGRKWQRKDLPTGPLSERDWKAIMAGIGMERYDMQSPPPPEPPKAEELMASSSKMADAGMDKLRGLLGSMRAAGQNALRSEGRQLRRHIEPQTKFEKAEMVAADGSMYMILPSGHVFHKASGKPGVRYSPLEPSSDPFKAFKAELVFWAAFHDRQGDASVDKKVLMVLPNAKADRVEIRQGSTSEELSPAEKYLDICASLQERGLTQLTRQGHVFAIRNFDESSRNFIVDIWGPGGQGILYMDGGQAMVTAVRGTQSSVNAEALFWFKLPEKDYKGGFDSIP